jgi:hypothetical protein
MKGLADTLGKGIVAGVVGTAAMTVSSTLEAKLRGRAFSTAPAKAAQRLLGIETFADEAAETRFSNLVHWGYGTGWGVARAALGRLLGPKAADAAHFAAVWGGALVMLPALGVAPPVWEWEGEDVGIDVFHHLVYVVSTGLAFDALD